MFYSGTLRLLAIACFFLSAHGLLSEHELQSLCPKDRGFCPKKASQAALHNRIQSCCKKVGKVEMKFCLPLCGYNTTLEALDSGLGVKCVSQLTTWAYCAADANDNRECCKAKGVNPECLSFCKGDVPTCDLKSIFAYQPCLKQMKAIVECHVENLSAEARFDPAWEAPCDWE
uniref:Domain of unknown function DB domain-containing protein n=1 Tax=Acrobeloides nanus TaxID=290746 RepID=A0A914CIS2_9BILA